MTNHMPSPDNARLITPYIRAVKFIYLLLQKTKKVNRQKRAGMTTNSWKLWFTPTVSNYSFQPCIICIGVAEVRVLWANETATSYSKLHSRLTPRGFSYRSLDPSLHRNVKFVISNVYRYAGFLPNIPVRSVPFNPILSHKHEIILLLNDDVSLNKVTNELHTNESTRYGVLLLDVEKF